MNPYDASKKEQFIALIVAGIIVTIIAFIVAVSLIPKKAGASQLPDQVCGNGEHVGNPHCITPTPIATPSATLTPTLTPTPTIDPCIAFEVAQYGDDQEVVCPTPTATPEATPSATPTPAVEPTPPPSSHGDGLSDGRSDGRSSSPQTTITPCTPTTCGWK
jgi:hypothetical protein